MMEVDGWRKMELGKFVTLQRGHDLPEPERRTGEVPIVGSFGVTGYHDVAKAKGPGVTVGRSGASFGVVSYSPVDYWPLNTALYVTNFHGNDERFAYYFLNSLDFTRYNSGSAQASLNRNYIHPITIEVPLVPEQRAIAHVLGAFDNKIELNRRMNETLEATARALFKSWFVDFDPVRARAEGRAPEDMDAETAALFPDSFEDSEFGEIPKSWRVGSVSNIAEVVMGQSPPGETYNEQGNGLPFYQGVRDFGFRFPLRRVYCTAPTRLAQKGDVLLSVRAPVGSLNVAIESCAVGRGVAALRPRVQPQGFLYYLLQSTQTGWQRFEAQGTVFGSASKQDVHSFKVIVPPVDLMRVYGRIVEPIDKRIKSNTQELQTLAAIRDALLPKLMSGEVRVRDAV